MVISLAWEGDWSITQHFGAHPEWYRPYGLPGHEGIDIGCPVGTRVRALYDGGIVAVGLDARQPWGFWVAVRTHAGGDFYYCHLEPYDLRKPGTPVMAGDPVGWTGTSGRSFGPHLHLSFRPRWWDHLGEWRGFLDPLPFLGIEP